MAPILAWLPFLVALMVAFASGIAFARVCHGRALTWPHLRRRGTGAGPESPADNPSAVTMLALCLVLIPIAMFAALLLLHVR